MDQGSVREVELENQGLLGCGTYGSGLEEGVELLNKGKYFCLLKCLPNALL